MTDRPVGVEEGTNDRRPEPVWRATALASLAALALLALVCRAWAADEAVPRASQGLTTGELEGRPEPFKPLRPRTEAEQDRLRAAAMFASGRMAEHRQDYAQALRLYQRALRLDPDATHILREVVVLAFSLDRHAEAVRYALILVDKDSTDPVLLRRLAMYLTEEGDIERALALYEKAAAIPSGEKPNVSDVSLWMEIGRLNFLVKRYAQAAERFAKVNEALEHPQDYGLDEAARKALLGSGESTYQLFGESFLEAGRPAEALAAFQKSHELKPDAGLLAFHLARLAEGEQKPTEALEKLQPYFDKHLSTRGTEPYQLLAKLLKDQDQENQLLGRLEALQAADAENIPLAYFLGQRYREAGQLEKSAEVYRRLIAAHPQRPPIEAFQGLVEIYRQSQQVEPLLKLLGDLVARSGSLAALDAEQKALAADGELVKSLIAAARRQAEVQAADLDYGARLATALLAVSIKDFDAAQEFFELAMASQPDKKGELLATWGLELFLAGRYDKAAAVFQRGIDESALPPDNPTFYFYLAGALEMADHTDEALEAARQAARLQPDSPRMLARSAWVLYHAQKYEEAKKKYLALLEKFDSVRDSTATRETLRDARLILSNIELVGNHYPEAEEWVEQVLDEFPDDAGAQNDLGYLWCDQEHNLERSLRMIRRAVELEPDNMAYRDSLGWAYFRLGRLPEAIAELKRAADVPEPDGVVLDHLGDALSKSGDSDGGLAAWRSAVRAFEKESQPDKAKRSQAKIDEATKPAAAKSPG